MSNLKYPDYKIYNKDKCISDITRVENLIGRIYIIMIEFNQIDILDFYENRVDLLLKIREDRIQVLKQFYFIHYRRR